MKSSWWGVALTYVGAVVGAGFASGQEIYQFFGRYGYDGVAGIVLAGIAFAVLGYLALERGRRDGITRFGELLDAVYPPWLVRLTEGITAAFLLVGLGVVSAGGGAAAAQVAHIPVLAGAALTTAAIGVVVARGVDSVVSANAVLIPYLIGLVVLVAVLTWVHPVRLAPPGGRPGWALSALLYLSYNIFTGIMVLLGIGPSLGSARNSWRAAIMGAGILSGLAILEHHTLLRSGAWGALPMVDIATGIHPTWGVLYSVSLWIALFTTGVAGAYALLAQYGRWILWAVGATFLFGLLGFEHLVASLYPIMGIVAIVLWIPLIYRPKRTFPGG